jgi:RNA polymerase sigma-70 factor (ECF subfamily)
MEGPAAPEPAAASFEAFFSQQYRAVVRLAQSVLGDFHAAQDVGQEVFLAAHRRFSGDLDGAAGWVRVASVHTALNMVRGQRRRQRRQLLGGSGVAGSAVHAPSAEETVIEREARLEIRRALATLPVRSATVLVLRHGGMSYLEIATALGIKVGHVGTMLRRAESALSKELCKEPGKERNRGTRT